MSNYALINATGASGSIYRFQVYPVRTEFKSNPGVYIFARWDPPSQPLVLYVGETDSFKSRLTQNLTAHQQYERAAMLGLSHLGVLHVPGARDNRLKIETDLRHAYNPACNDQPNALLEAMIRRGVL
jgi:hypothetical protein